MTDPDDPAISFGYNRVTNYSHKNHHFSDLNSSNSIDRAMLGRNRNMRKAKYLVITNAFLQGDIRRASLYFEERKNIGVEAIQLNVAHNGLS